MSSIMNPMNMLKRLTRILIAGVLLFTCPIHINADTILQAFWWDCQNEYAYAKGKDYRFEWYNYIRDQLPRIEAIGFTALWTPPPCKSGNASGFSMGYDVYDHYDLGEKPHNQPKSKPDGRTMFGTRDELLRLVASAHAHGIDIYPDIVLNHMSGGREDQGSPAVDANGHKTDDRWKNFTYSAAAGPDTGRWPKGWWNFHPNPDHDSINSNDIDTEMWGPDICYDSNHDANGKPYQGYMLNQALDWFEWFSNVTGVDGYRFDAVRHYESRVVRDLLKREESVRGRKPFAVVEYGTWDTSDLDRYIKETDGRAHTFDFPLHDQLFKMVFARGMYNIGSLPDFLQKDGAHSVSFVNSHDTVRGAAGNHQTIPPEDPWADLAYAFILSLDRTPCVFYEDLFPNHSVQLRRYGNPSTRPVREWLADLVTIRERFASGPVLYPLRSEDLLAIERPGRMVTIINDNGADWKEAALSTSFGAGIELKDITGQSDAHITTGTGDDTGKIKVWLPPVSYMVLVKASEAPLHAINHTPRRTVQQIEFADDLSTGSLSGKPRIFKFWPAKNSRVSVDLKLTGNGIAQVDLLTPTGKLCSPSRKFNEKNGEWITGEEGWYSFEVRLKSENRIPAFLKVDYMGN